jgi:ribose transport system substrate-binding protein
LDVQTIAVRRAEETVVKRDRLVPGASRRRIALAVAIAMLSLGVVACGSNGDAGGDTSGGGGGEQYRIVQVPTSLSDFTHTVNLGARAAAAEAGATVDLQIPGTADAAGQTATLNAVIATRPDAILLEPIDGEAMLPAVEQAKKAGIKVVTYDSNVVDESAPDAFVAVDYVRFGSDIARTLDELVGGEGKLLHLAGLPGLPVSQRMKEGYLEYVRAHPRLTSLPIDYTQFETSRASAITEATLTAHPDLAGAFIGGLTELSGALSALERAGALGRVRTIGWDGTPEGIQRMRDGELDRIISAPAGRYGEEAVKAAVAALNGEEPAIGALSACVLSADNVDDPASAPCVFQQAKDSPN